MNKHGRVYARLQHALGATSGRKQLLQWLRHGDPHHDRWNGLQRWLRAVDSSGRGEAGSGTKTLLFSTLPYWNDISLALATCLVSEGAEVHFVWCPWVNFDPKPSVLARLHDRFSAHFPSSVQDPRLRVSNMLQLPRSDLSAQALQVAHEQSLIDTSYVLRRESLNLEGNKHHRAVFERRLNRNSLALRCLYPLLASGEYDAFLTPHGNLIEFGAGRRLAATMDIPTVTYEFWEEKQTIIAALGDPCVRLDTRAIWEADEPHTLSAERRSRMTQLMNMREGTTWNNFTVSYQRGDKQAARELAERYQLENGKPTLLMCPNVAWDNLHWQAEGFPFTKMIVWVRETVRFLARRSDCNVLIRCHPSESTFGTNESVYDTIMEELKEVPQHMSIIPSEDDTNTYGLMDLADLGVVFVSTTGLEMTMRGTPVVCGGPAHYARKGFTVDARDKAEYFDALERLIRSPRPFRLTERQIELAQCYMDVYLYGWTRPFPWSIATFYSDLDEWPMERVLSAEGRARFSSTFRYLAGGWRVEREEAV